MPNVREMRIEPSTPKYWYHYHLHNYAAGQGTLRFTILSHYYPGSGVTLVCIA
jgi:hypothetical protein